MQSQLLFSVPCLYIFVSAKSDYISAFKSAFLPACLSANLQTDLLFFKSAPLQIYFSTNLQFCKSGCQSANLLFCKSAFLQICKSACLSANLLFCKSAFLQIWQSAFLQICKFAILLFCKSTFLQICFFDKPPTLLFCTSASNRQMLHGDLSQIYQLSTSELAPSNSSSP